MTDSRRASVYDYFIGCVNDLQLVDPCDEEADLAVAGCAADADVMACAETDARCDTLTVCSEVSTEECETALAPFSGWFRDSIVACVDYYASEASAPDYEGCGFDFEYCLSPSGE